MEEAEISDDSDYGVILRGSYRLGGTLYSIILYVEPYEEATRMKMHLRPSLDGDRRLSEIYPLARTYIAWDYYNQEIDISEHLWLKEAEITADSGSNDTKARLRMELYFDEESVFYQYYRKLVPEAYEVLTYEGTITDPLGKKHYIVEAPFLKDISFPLSDGSIDAKECRLILNSHVLDPEAENEEDRYSCRFGVGFLVKLPGVQQEDVRGEIDLARLSNGYFLSMTSDNGFSHGDLMELFHGISGMSGLPSLPGWADPTVLPLTGVTLKLGDLWDRSDRLMLGSDALSGVLFCFAFDPKVIPLPYFQHPETDVRADLFIQWDLLEIGGSQLVSAVFQKKWDAYTMQIRLEFPDLILSGVLARDHRETGNHLFPGFMGLSVEYVRLDANLNERSFELYLELEDPGEQTPLAVDKDWLRIDGLSGNVLYSPHGYEISIGLRFVLLSIQVITSGSYSNLDGQKLLTLRGGIGESFSLRELIRAIEGTDAVTVREENDLTVDKLSIDYVTLLPGDGAANSLGETQHFEFRFGMTYDWGDSNSVASSFHLKWDHDRPDVYEMFLTATVKLLDMLEAAARCSVAIENGDFQFKDFLFSFKLRSILIEANVNNDLIQFSLKNFNLGELIEGIVSLFEPGHNWFLPWPFGILKQLTLKDLDVRIDRKKQELAAAYKIDLKILFLTVESIDLKYAANGLESTDQKLAITVKTNASIGAEDGDTSAYDIFPLDGRMEPFVKDLRNRLFKLQYLGIGQHISVKIPETVDERTMEELLSSVKKGITADRKGAVLDPDNNWIAALQMKLIDAIDVMLLFCDPSFYGIKMEIGKGSEMVEQLAGLSLTILYSKVTETIGVFYGHLKFPTAFRTIELGAVQVKLGGISAWIYTNGNFKIDMGFPHDHDFSESFGLTYLIFTGKGGFYFGLLNGDTSKAVPAVQRGHFETVLELGIGISAGVGREIAAGPLRAGAYLTLVAIFEGVFADYVPAEAGGKDSLYYKVQAYAGVKASIYGSVDFVLIKAGFSADLSLTADLTLELYKETVLTVEAQISVSAYVKIWFIHVSFRFRFHWSDSFRLGSAGKPPWELPDGTDGIRERIPSGTYELNWYDGQIFPERKTIGAEILPFFTLDEAGETAGSGRRKLVLTVSLHAPTKRTCDAIGYQESGETPFAVLVEFMLRRLILSILPGVRDEDIIPVDALSFLEGRLREKESFFSGFLSDGMEECLSANVEIAYIRSDRDSQEEIDGIPFVLSPELMVSLDTLRQDGTGGYDTETHDLGSMSPVDELFLANDAQYYEQLAIWTQGGAQDWYTAENVQWSSSTWLFAQYLYILSKAVCSEALDAAGGEGKSLRNLISLLAKDEHMERLSGMMSRFVYGGARVYDAGRDVTGGMLGFAGQTFDSMDPAGYEDGALVHRLHIGVRNTDTVQGRFHGVPLRLVHRGPLRSAGTPTADISWDFQKEEISYPAGGIALNGKPELMPAWRMQPQTIPLNDPMVQRAEGERDVRSFWKLPSVMSGDWTIGTGADEIIRLNRLMNGLGEEASSIHVERNSRADEPYMQATPDSGTLRGEPVVYERGFMLRVPLREVGEGIFSLEPVGYDERDKISHIRDHAVRISLLRAVNALDEAGGIVGDVLELDPEGGVLLYRTDLCLEEEKPDRLFGDQNASYKHSAELSETGSFLSLLTDATMVNGRGYFIRFALDDRQCLADGRMTAIFWVEMSDGEDADVVRIDGIGRDGHPVLVTAGQRAVSVTEPGTIRFMMKADAAMGDADESGETLQSLYQMLEYQVCDAGLFTQSHESAPLIAQEIDGKNGYSQIVPVSRFAKDVEGEGHYGGIRPGSEVSLRFRLIDLFGHRSAAEQRAVWSYGYSDPLLPISTLPHTGIHYRVEREEKSGPGGLDPEGADGRYRVTVTMRYIEETEERERRLLLERTNGADKNSRLLMDQIQCEDVECSIHLVLGDADKGNATTRTIQADKQALVKYMQALIGGEIPQDISLAVFSDIEAPERAGKLSLSFEIARDTLCVMEAYREDPMYEEVRRITTPIREDKEALARDFLAVDGARQEIYLVRPVEPDALLPVDPVFWTLPPVTNHLVDLRDIDISDKAGEGGETVSYYGADMGLWAEEFLRDMESLLSPGSIYKGDRDARERLLEIKRKLAERIAAQIIPLKAGASALEDQRRCAGELYENAMLRDLEAGYGINGVVTLVMDRKPVGEEEWCFDAAFDGDGDGIVSLMPGRMTSAASMQGGILPLAFRATDPSRQARVIGKLRLKRTDIYRPGSMEAYGSVFGKFLTIQEPDAWESDLSCDIPFKQYPPMPVLDVQLCDGKTADRNDGDLHGSRLWDYSLRFLHQTAAQDEVTIRLLMGDGAAQDEEQPVFYTDMAKYRYRRDRFLTDISEKEQLISLGQRIAEEWSFEGGVQRFASERELRVRFSIAPAEGVLTILETDIKNSSIQVAMKDREGLYQALASLGEGRYRMPEHPAVPYVYEFTLMGLDICEVSRMNAALSVTRNSGIQGIDGRFIYQTAEVRFTDALCPRLSRLERIDAGGFTRERFREVFMDLSDSFCKVSLEAYGLAPVAQAGDETIYSSLPILFVPEILSDQYEAMEERVYDRIRSWLDAGFAGRTAGMRIQLRETMFDRRDTDRRLLELGDVEFEL